jgi:hypothetical protein
MHVGERMMPLTPIEVEGCEGPREPSPGRAVILPASVGGAQAPARTAPAGSEDLIEGILGTMSRELVDQALVDRSSLHAHREKCRAMRKKILEQERAIRQASRRRHRTGLAARIFKWVAAVLGAIAAAVGAVFTGGQSLTAYAIGMGAAAAAGALGTAGGGCAIASSAAGKKELDAGARLTEARTELAVGRQMQELLLDHLGDLQELDARVGEQARAIMQRFDGLRQLALQWR